MALPPIIANNPLVKLLRSEQQNGGDNVKKSESASRSGEAPLDVVEISEAARKKFGEARLLADRQARATAEETRDILGKDVTQTLGLDPGFVE